MARQKQQTPKSFVFVSTADWDNPYWTNKQHVAAGLARLGHFILYIESQGLREPTLTGKDAGRIWTRLKRGLVPPREVQARLWVWSPLVIPFQRHRTVRLANRFILSAFLRLWKKYLGLGSDVLWTYSPLTTELYNVSDYDLIVYHAVDDISAQPGMPVEAIRAGEAQLLARADLVFVTSINLLDSHKELNPSTFYFSNVADFEHFNAALSPETPILAEVAAIPEPRIGFVGAIASYKLDFEMIRAVAGKRPEWSFVFVGEIGEGDPLTDASAITALPNLHFLGGKSYQLLPSIMKGLDVGLLPNRINDYTKSMFPMKFFEYLAAGRPIVSVRLHALQEHKDVVAFASDAAEMEQAIERVLAGDGATLEARLATARAHTYEARTEKMLALVDKALAAKSAQPREAHE